MSTKFNIFGPISFRESTIRPTREYLKIRHELIGENIKKENEMRLEQARRDQIFRKYLNQQGSFHRDFHTLRY
jgi:hypothetical protein